MIKRGPDVLWRATDGLLALSRPGGTVITITGPGADVWWLLENPATLERLVADLTARYGGSPSVIRADVEALLAQLRRQQFVVDG